MELKNTFKLFAKLYFGIASDKERKKIFYSKESEKMMDDEWENSGKKLPLSKVEKSKIYKDIYDEMFLVNNKHAQKQIINFIRKYAALLVLFLSLATTVSYILFSEKPTDTVTYITKENQSGNRSEFLLPDGTKVWLNADSKLVFPEKFPEHLREVRLTGEAYFEVKENKEKPFRVITKDVDIEVLGTVFNVAAYPDDETIETTLVSGKVAVSDNSKTKDRYRYIMSKEHLAVFSKKQRKFTIDKTDVYKYTSWKDGKLIFDNVTFFEISKKLERIYDVKFVKGKEILDNYHYTITITNESIDEIMQLISKTTPVEYTIEGKNIYIEEIKN